MSISPDQLMMVVEALLVLGGLAFLGWYFFSDRGRALRIQPPALPLWDISLSDFLLLAWLVLVLGFGFQVLLRFTVGPALHRLPDSEMLELVVYGTMFHWAAILIWFGAGAVARQRRRKAGLPELAAARFRIGASGRPAVLTFLAALPLISGASLIWERLLEILGLPLEPQELVDFFQKTRSPLLLGIMILLALVVAPVAEELIFRAGIFRFLRTRLPRWVAFVGSAAFFALLHANWASALPLFVLGLIFAYAYERTGRITVTIFAHALFNLNTLLLVLSGLGS